MAFLFADSFDHYSIGQITRKYTAFSGAGGNPVSYVESLANGRHSSNGLNLFLQGGAVNQGTSNRAMIVLPATGPTCIAGFAFKTDDVTQHQIGTNEVTDASLFAVRYLDVAQCWFRLNGDGTISALRGTTILGTSSAAISDGAVNFLEFKVTVDTTTGVAVVRINGVTVLNLTNVNTCGQGTEAWNAAAFIRLRVLTNHTATWNMDDLYVLDGSGSTSNDFLNDVRVDALFPDADGANTAWTPSTGTDHFALVDDNPANDDTDYNSSSGVGNKDTFGFPNAPVSGADIHAVQLCATVRKTDAGTAMHKGIWRTGGVDYLSGELGVSSSYAILRSIFDRQPSDNSVINDTKFNAAEFGLQKSG